METVDKQIMSEETVAALTLDVPSGSHAHSFDGFAKTNIGGNHAHVFIVPNGDQLRTELGGEHYHDLCVCTYGGNVEWDGYGGQHAHGLTLQNGERVMTEDEGYHSHHWSQESDLPTGQHRHTLMLPSGLVLMSAMPGDRLWDLAREASIAGQLVDMTKALGNPPAPSTPYPVIEKRYNIAAVAALVLKDGAAQFHLEFDYGGRPLALVADIARKGAARLDTIAPAAELFGPRGSRYTIDMLDAEIPARLTKAVLIKGEVAEIEKCKLDCGYLTANTREFYVKGDKIRGRIVVETSGDVTIAKFTTDLVPEIITKALQNEVEVPPYGVSAMPAWLSYACPTEYMYWQEPDREIAKSKLLALAASGFYSAEKIAFVYDEPRVIKRESLVKLYRPGSGDVASPVEVVNSHEEQRSIPAAVQRMKSAAVPGTWGPATEPGVDATHFVIELPSTAEDGSGVEVSKADLDVAVARIAASDRAYLVETADTPLTREAFAPLGPMFKFVSGPESARLFIASFDPALSQEQIEFVKFNPAESAVVKRLSASTGAMDLGAMRVIAKSADSAEQRIVLGIVLEPDFVDAQNDTISGETIRHAAHKFMESFQNMGLQHKQIVNDKVKLLESYLTLCDMDIGGQTVKAGTWLMVTRYDDDDLWEAIKSGRLTGYSIGGFARRTPVNA